MVLSSRRVISGTDHFHLLPVVGKLFTTIQAHDVGGSGHWPISTRLTGFRGYRKGAVLVGTAKQCIDKSRHLIPLRRNSGDSLVPDENEPTLIAKVSLVY